MTKKLYSLTPGHKKILATWADKWIANARSTKAMTAEDRAATVKAVVGLYEAAGMKPPPVERIVFVPSPFVARFATGAAAWIWHCRKNPTTAATAAATAAAATATDAAATTRTDAAAATDAIDAATRATIDAATATTATIATMRAATTAADAIDAIDLSRWFIDGGCAGAVLKIAGQGGLDVARKLWYWNSGNLYNGWYLAYLSFFRQVAKLPIDWRKWVHFENAAVHSGPRYMHPEFCIVSDRPERLMVDAQHRPHCDDGPCMRWRDGTAIYMVHGVQTPAWIIERPETITAAAIDAEKNAEVRRVMVSKMGMERYLRDGNAKLVHKDARGKLFRKEQAGDEAICMLEVVNSTPEPDGSFKHYMLGVPPTVRTASEAYSWTRPNDWLGDALNGNRAQANPSVES